MTETEAWVALNLLPGLGAIRVGKLLARFSSPTAILSASSDELRQVAGVGPELASLISEWPSHISLDAEMAKIEAGGCHILTPSSHLYPDRLRQIHSPPLVLYVRGEIQESDRHAIAVVGSRQCTHYGLQTTKKLSFQLAAAGYTVVSGLARGIDTAAHEAALAAKGRTIAVIGSGLNKIYPAENVALARRIAETGGAVISEFPMDCPPEKMNFPLRNRIVSGWCAGLLIVEAPGRSGALITANQALEEGRNVYAVPGNIDRPSSLGCNRLIQQGAKLVNDVSDIIEDLQSLLPAPKAGQSKPEPAGAPPSMTPEESAVYHAIGNDERHSDELAATTGLASNIIMITLMKMELKRWVKALPGGRYVRLIG